MNAAIADLGFPTVATDDAHAVEQAYGHLSSLGHDSIGLILGPSDHVPSSRKLTAFQASHAQAGADPETARPGRLVERTMFSMEGGHAAASRLIKRGVTGIICASDVQALGAVRAVRRLGMRVPDDVSVVGYDDSIFMPCTDPPMTTIRQPIEAMGQAVVALLVSEIAGNAVPTDELLFEPELVVRGSTGAAPTGNPAPAARAGANSRRAPRTAV